MRNKKAPDRVQTEKGEQKYFTVEFWRMQAIEIILSLALCGITVGIILLFK